MKHRLDSQRSSTPCFCIKCNIDKYISIGNNKLYTCFIDFRKAFDKVVHVGIMLKLLRNNIDGYFYRILNDMYSFNKLHVCVKISDKRTDFYISEVGVRQWDLLSPNLFKLFINDLPYILEQNTTSVEINNKYIPCLLYADDLIIFSDTKEGLQEKLNILEKYTAKTGV